MNTVALIQPSELGADFKFEGGKWQVNFPTSATPPPPISNNARNIIKDSAGMFIDKRDRLAYALIQDNDSQKIRLYSHPQDELFNLESATLASEIDMLAMNGQFDDIAIDEGVITFTDVQTGSTLTLNTNELQRVGSLKASNSVAVAEDVGILKLTAKLDTNPNNLLKVTSGGLEVSPDRIEELFNSKLAAANIHTQEMFKVTDHKVGHVIGDQLLSIPKVRLENTGGVFLGSINDPQTLEKSSSYTFPSEVAIKLHYKRLSGIYSMHEADAALYVNGVKVTDRLIESGQSSGTSVGDPRVFVSYSSTGTMWINAVAAPDNGYDTTPIEIKIVPNKEKNIDLGDGIIVSTADYINAFLEHYRSARVENGDLYVTMQPSAKEN